MPELPERQEYFIKGKDIITDPNAPVISDEFVDVRNPHETYQGGTIEVQSKVKLEDDLGTGEAVIMRSYTFVTNPEYLRPDTKWPSNQEIFDSHMKGIAGLLWQDGLTPATDIEPRLIFTPDRKSYLIMVWARPSLGQTVAERPNTLSEIVHGKNGSRQDRNTLQRSVPIPSVKEKKASRTAKTPK